MSEGNGSIGSMGAVVTASVHETSVAAVAAQAKATVEARYIVAQGRPRDWDQARVRILAECKRPRFAEVARYAKPIGGSRVEGPSIRFAEAALRCMGNVDISTPTTYDDDDKRIIRVSVTDLETNATYSSDITMQKTVERRQVKPGQQVIGERLNSTGQKVFIVRATEDDLLTKQAALVSKAIRTNGLRILPGDIVEEAMDMVLSTLRDRDARDPNEARKRIIDAFSSVGVTPAQLRTYLEHEIEHCVPAELADLRAVYAAIRDGETTWADVLRQSEDGDGKRPVTERGISTLDERDVKKAVDAAEKRAAKVGDGVCAADVLRTLLGERPLSDVPKSDLPALMIAISKWEPPVGEATAAGTAETQTAIA